MHFRVAAALAATCCLGLPAAYASAAPCQPWVTDATGDARPSDLPVSVPAPVNEADLDILAIDLSSNAKTLTISVHLAEVNTKPAPHRLITVLLPSGKDFYQAYWYVGTDEQRFVFTNLQGDHDVPGSADTATGLVRFKVPRTLLPRAVKRFSAEGDAAVLVGDNSSGDVYYFDSAGSNRLYTLGTSGCL